MRQLNGVYTQRFNRTHGRAGHVFQGQFKTILVDKDDYLLELARYVVLNPLRAKMVRRLEQWPWSSYRATCGQAVVPDWLRIGWPYLAANRVALSGRNPAWLDLAATALALCARKFTGGQEALAHGNPACAAAGAGAIIGRVC
jgi:hypothetical protein